MESERPVHLHWVTVPDDPSEDWFVFAAHALMARRFFAEYEGFATREAEARLVERNVRVQMLEHSVTPRWANLSELEALGFEILGRTPHLRSVCKAGETFVEGYLQAEIVQIHDDLAEAAGRGRPHGNTATRKAEVACPDGDRDFRSCSSFLRPAARLYLFS